jgi:hypothetical protein
MGIVVEEQHRRFREGPLEIGIADLRARGAIALACRFLGTLDQTAVGDEILHPEETMVCGGRDLNKYQELAADGGPVARCDRWSDQRLVVGLPPQLMRESFDYNAPESI